MDVRNRHAEGRRRHQVKAPLLGGPRKVLEPIRDLIYRMFPAIRRNPDTDVDTDT